MSCRVCSGRISRNADRGGGLFDFAVESFFQVEEFIEAGVGEHAADHYLLVVGPDTVDPSVALDKAHGVPGKVVVDDVAGLLQVYAFG